MITLKQQTVSGIKWLVGSSFLQKAIQLAGTVILARILGPSQFGLFALAFVAIDALGLFKSMGFDSALIQRKDDIERAANTAFFIIPVLGILLYLVLFISAPLIGKFLNNQEVIGVVQALGIIFVISCLGRVPAALMEKNMQFKQISIIEIGMAVIYSASAVIFALLKFGVWSLVYAYILKTLYQNTLTFIYAKWRPKFQFDKKIVLEMFHFGKFLFLGGIIWFLKMNLDNMLVGKILGVTALGLYAVAFNIANFGSDYFGGKVYKVIFPAFSQIQSDKNDLKRAFLKTLKFISIFAFPFFIGIFFLGNEIIKIIYGKQWAEAIPVLRVLAFAGLFNTLTAAVGSLWVACGNSKSGFWFSVIQVVLFVLLVAPLAKLYGLVGVGFVVALSSVIAIIVFLPFTMKLIDLKLNEIFICLRPSLISSSIMGLTIFVYRLFSLNMLAFININLYWSFTILTFLSTLLYMISLRVFDKTILNEIKGMLIRTK